MSLTALVGAIELGILYALLASGLFVSFRVLNVADLTVEGSFTLGAACSAVLTLAGHPVLGILAALFAGSLAGLLTAILHTKLKIIPILAGILTMTALYSINLRIMDKKGNVSLLGSSTIFTAFSEFLGGFQYAELLLGVLILGASVALLTVFFHTQLGLSIRATGDNADMVRSSSINTNFTQSVGLAVANALVALSGALVAQYQMFADIGMGIGMVVIGLASLIIGEVLIGTKSILRHLIAVCAGAVLYRIIIALVLQANVAQSDLKIISAVLVAAALSFPAIRANRLKFRLRKENRRA